jgi:hypothetical protein
MNAMMADWMFYFVPMSIWFAMIASASVTLLLARRRHEQLRQEKLNVAFVRARSVRLQGYTPIERSEMWK